MPRETQKITVEISRKHYDWIKENFKSHGSMRLVIDKAIELLIKEKEKK